MTRARHRVASVDELASDGDRVIADIGGSEIAVFRVRGDLHALANYCVHQAGPLCEGDLVGRFDLDTDREGLRYDDEPCVVRCPWHGWRFDVETGESLQSGRYRTPTYDVEVDGDDVYVYR